MSHSKRKNSKKENKRYYSEQNKRKENSGQSRLKKLLAGNPALIHAIINFILILLGVFVVTGMRWGFTTWSNLNMQEISYELSNSLSGTSSNIMMPFYLTCILPSVLAAVFITAIIYRSERAGKNVGRINNVVRVLSFCGVIGGFLFAWYKLDMTSFVIDSFTDSTYIEDNYADPAAVQISFPEKKRNLIYIYLESMEDTYSDKADNGAFQSNIIPELTELAENYEDFSGTDEKLNGSYAMTGATWTMGAMFAQTSGLPLKTGIGNNGMKNQTDFFPSITTLGDILEKEGYHQVFMLGSDASFGGRELYFKEHGNYDILDYNYAIRQGWIPSDYKVWWGYEDEKLFSFAKKELEELASSDQPFNLTLLTVDTHFTDGYLCDLCPDTFGDNQYANVMACSSKQVYDFVKWIQSTDFYDNTTIIISGDHLTMDGDFCKNVDTDYQRKVYTCYINSAAEPAEPDETRIYNTFDNFPTTLAALGCNIDGERLGLGTNLYSDMPTRLEESGVIEMNAELSRKSSFMEEKSGVSKETLRIAEELENSDPEVSIDSDENEQTVSFTVSGLTDVDDVIWHLYISVFDSDGERILLKSASEQSNGSWKLTVKRSGLGKYKKLTYKIHVDSEAGDIYICNGESFSIS